MPATANALGALDHALVQARRCGLGCLAFALGPCRRFRFLLRFLLVIRNALDRLDAARAEAAPQAFELPFLDRGNTPTSACGSASIRGARGSSGAPGDRRDPRRRPCGRRRTGCRHACCSRPARRRRLRARRPHSAALRGSPRRRGCGTARSAAPTRTRRSRDRSSPGATGVRIDREPGQVGQRRVAGAEVVDRHLEAEGLHPPEQLHDLVGALHQHALGHLQRERRPGSPVARQDVAHLAGQGRVELAGRTRSRPS